MNSRRSRKRKVFYERAKNRNGRRLMAHQSRGMVADVYTKSEFSVM